MVTPGLYRHYKGALYYVLHVGICSDNGPNNGKNVVIYQSVGKEAGVIYTRLMDEFEEPVLPETFVPGPRCIRHIRFVRVTDVAEPAKLVTRQAFNREGRD